MSKLNCCGLTKKYKEKAAVDRLELELESNRIYGLIGRNGAGKTTLLSLMSNQVPVTEGKVLLDGENIWENRKAMERICCAREMAIGQNSVIFSTPVKGFLDLAKCYYTKWNNELEKQLLDEFEINPKKKIGTLSKGMVSSVSIIFGLCSGAEFTYMDEPTSGLDVVARERFYNCLLQEHENSERTFVLSTHIIDEAADLMDEVIIIDKGRVLCKEKTRRLVENTYRVSGPAGLVDGAIKNYPVHHVQSVGTQKAVTLTLPDGTEFEQKEGLTVQSLSLQQIFVSLCGGTAE